MTSYTSTEKKSNTALIILIAGALSVLLGMGFAIVWDYFKSP